MSAGADAMPAMNTSPLGAAVAALSVGVLSAATLGTVAAVIVGSAMHLLGLPDLWAEGLAAVAAAASLPFCGLLARRAWRAERGSPDA